MWNLSTFSNYQVDFQDQIFHLNFLIKHDFFFNHIELELGKPDLPLVFRYGLIRKGYWEGEDAGC